MTIKKAGKKYLGGQVQGDRSAKAEEFEELNRLGEEMFEEIVLNEKIGRAFLVEQVSREKLADDNETSARKSDEMFESRLVSREITDANIDSGDALD